MKKQMWRSGMIVRFLSLDFLFFLLFLFLDLFVPEAAEYANALKFVTTIFAWCIGILGYAPMIAIGLTITVISDYLLIFTDRFAAGVLFFSLAHWCYISYHYDRRQMRRRLCSFVPLPLLFSACFYAVSLICDVLYGVKEAEEQLNKETKYFAIGIVLFFLCDVTTAYFYFSKSPVAATLIWVFYTPSQALIAVSAFFAKEPQPQKK